MSKDLEVVNKRGGLASGNDGVCEQRGKCVLWMEMVQYVVVSIVQLEVIVWCMMGKCE